MIKTSIILLFLLIFAACGKVANKNQTSLNDTLSIATSPKNATDADTIPMTLKAFIPEGYALLNNSTGDVNLDEWADKILVLEKTTTETVVNDAEAEPQKRVLLLLLGQADESFRLAFRNENAVYGIDNPAILDDPFTGITIKNGYFSIEHGIAAGNQHWQRITTFQYEKVSQKWFLYKDYFVSYKMNDSDDANAEALILDVETKKTAKDFGTIAFEKFNIYTEN
jgi:hypothetical protein